MLFSLRVIFIWVFTKIFVFVLVLTFPFLLFTFFQLIFLFLSFPQIIFAWAFPFPFALFFTFILFLFIVLQIISSWLIVIAFFFFIIFAFLFLFTLKFIVIFIFAFPFRFLVFSSALDNLFLFTLIFPFLFSLQLVFFPFRVLNPIPFGVFFDGLTLIFFRLILEVFLCIVLKANLHAIFFPFHLSIYDFSSYFRCIDCIDRRHHPFSSQGISLITLCCRSAVQKMSFGWNSLFEQSRDDLNLNPFCFASNHPTF